MIYKTLHIKLNVSLLLQLGPCFICFASLCGKNQGEGIKQYSIKTVLRSSLIYIIEWKMKCCPHFHTHLDVYIQLFRRIN